MMRACTLLVTTLVMLASATHASAQEPQDTMRCTAELRSIRSASLTADLARTLDISGAQSSRSFLIDRLGVTRPVPVCGATASLQRMTELLAAAPAAAHSLQVFPVEALLAQNSAYPRDWNDGALWSGVGLSLAASGGAQLRWGVLEIALAPTLVLEQNDGYARQPFPDSSVSPYVHRWHGRFIDLPQRPGANTRMYVDLGQSHITARIAGMRAGLSRQNLVWGPARRNPLLLSATAPGFAHVFVETDGLRRAGPVDVEAQLLVGRLEESDHFDFDARNDQRALFGAAGSISPRGADGLYVGAGYLHMQQWNDATSAHDILVAPITGLGPDSVGFPRDLRLFSLFMRWASASAGLEIYGEVARQDSWKEWLRLLNPLDAPQAYTFGLRKLVPRGDNAIVFSAEVSHLADPLPHSSVGRGITTFYVSPYVRQGHTHRGQLLGAPIGPGSESQFIGVDVFSRRGRSSFSVERVRYDDDAYYAIWARHHSIHGHDTEFSVRAGHAFAAGPVVVDGGFGYSRRYSRSFLGLGHVNYPGYPYRTDDQFEFRITGHWQPPALSIPLR